MRLCLAETSIDGLSPYSFLCNYRGICGKLGIVENTETRPIYEKLYKKVESKLPDLIWLNLLSIINIKLYKILEVL